MNINDGEDSDRPQIALQFFITIKSSRRPFPMVAGC